MKTTFDFSEKYNLVKNPRLEKEKDNESEFNPYPFEFSPKNKEDMDYIKEYVNKNPNCQWTYLMSDFIAIVPGLRFVNRDHYLLTDKPWENEEEEYIEEEEEEYIEEE